MWSSDSSSWEGPAHDYVGKTSFLFSNLMHMVTSPGRCMACSWLRLLVYANQITIAHYRPEGIVWYSYWITLHSTSTFSKALCRMLILSYNDYRHNQKGAVHVQYDFGGHIVRDNDMILHQGRSQMTLMKGSRHLCFGLQYHSFPLLCIYAYKLNTILFKLLLLMNTYIW